MSLLNLFNPKCQSQKNNNTQMMSQVMSDWEFVVIVNTKWRALIGRKYGWYSSFLNNFSAVDFSSYYIIFFR